METNGLIFRSGASRCLGVKTDTCCSCRKLFAASREHHARSGRISHNQAEFFAWALFGVDAPQIDGESPRRRHGGALARTGVLGGAYFVQRPVAWLLGEHAPDRLEEHMPHLGIAVLADGVLTAVFARGALART